MSRLFFLALAITPAFAQSVPKDQPFRGRVVNPSKTPFSPDFASRLRVPAGYRAEIFAKELKGPRVILPLADGSVLVSSDSAGTITRLKDGVATVAASGYPGLHGLAEKDGEIFFATVTELFKGKIGPDGRMTGIRRLTDRLPQGGQHARRTMAFGPDGMLYVNLGSRTNDVPAPQPEDACLYRLKPDGSGGAVFAKGLRNTLGFAFHPVTKALWGWDHGSDYRGDEVPFEELNRIEEGKDYGWPWAYGARRTDPLVYRLPKGYTSLEAYVATTAPATIEYAAHSAPIQTVFTPDGREMFVTMKGSWNRSQPTGYKVVRVPFDASGLPGKPVDFVTGFLAADGRSYIGRPAGLALLADGSMLVGDDTNGVIYRISRR